MIRRNRIFIFCLFSLTLVFLVFSTSVFAAALPDYRERIRNAKESLDLLIYSDEEESNKDENLEFEREILKEIRADLPVKETVEWQNGSVEVDNGWILEKLKAFESEKIATRRTAIISEISQRLGAIEAKLVELETAEKAARSKDEDKQKLAEILRRTEYRKPEEKQESLLQQTWREFWEWVRRMFPKPNFGAPSADGFQSFTFVLQIIIFALVLGGIGFLIYRFAPFLRVRFREREKKDKGARVILGEHLAADETSFNLFSEAEKLAREGNLRAAIRKGYIALLCDLSDRKIIGLAQHKTNRDYLRDVGKMTELHQNMSGLTGSFERHWYGFAPPEQQDWDKFREGYQKTTGKS